MYILNTLRLAILPYRPFSFIAIHVLSCLRYGCCTHSDTEGLKGRTIDVSIQKNPLQQYKATSVTFCDAFHGQYDHGST